jgi:RNA polymerase sigma factor (sigma-70 family)
MSPYESLCKKEASQYLDRAMESLTEREQSVMDCRYVHSMTRADTSSSLGISTSRVRKVELKAIAKLRRNNDVRTAVELFGETL